MRALLVGAGGMGQAWARNLLSNPECKIVGWVDLRPDAATAAAESHGLGAVHTGGDLNEAITACAPDFVVDVSAPEGHHTVTLTALSRGLPVIGEKPMAVNLDQAKEMVKASEKAGKLYMVSQSRRYEQGMVALRKAIHELGGLGILNVDFYLGPHFGGFRDEMESPLLLDMAIHTFDQARFLSEADPVSVIAEEFNPSWSWYKGDAAANASFLMSDGTRFNYRGCWCSEGETTSWEGDWRAVGKRGTALWEKNGDVRINVASGNAVIEQDEIPNGIAGSLAEFLHALKTGETPQGECHDNIKSLAMVFAAKESAKMGRRVDVRWV